MRIRSRRIHRSYRRFLLAACLGGPVCLSFCGPGLSAEEVGSELRVLNAPVELPVGMPAKTPVLSKAHQDSQVQLASDGWTARGGVSRNTQASPANRSEAKPNRFFGATPAAHADDSTSDAGYVGSGIQSAETPETNIDEPKSTLNFILPKDNRGLTESIAPSIDSKLEPSKRLSLELPPKQDLPASPSASAQSERYASELYGPGPQIGRESQIAVNDKAGTRENKGSASQASPVEPELVSPNSLKRSAAEPVATKSTSNPEQNEPQNESANESQSHTARTTSEPSTESELEALPGSDEPLELVPYYDEDAGQQGKPMEVRELKLRSDGTLGSSSNEEGKRKLPADTISNRSGSSRQSVGDGVNVEEIRAVPNDTRDTTRDSINAAGELKLSLGLTEGLAISATAARLRTPLERTLNYYWMRPENATERTHWGMFHQMMIYDKDTQIIHHKQQYNAVAWMAGNNPCRDQLLYDRDQHGIVVKEGIGLQGHQAQMLAVFGLVDVPASYPIYVSKHKFAVSDVVQREMKACRAGAELTFTLIGLSHYIDTDQTWTSFDGEQWSFERLIQEELAQPVVGAACGGTHRLMGFAHALRRRRAEGKPITGQWARADKYVRDFIAYTWQLQNRDGSMSTAWFEGPEDNGKIDRKIQTTGHMVEFLLTAVNDDELQSPQMLRAISYLNSTLYEERGHEWQVGPKGHALRALVLYYQRVYGRPDPWRSSSVATRPAQTRR